MAVVLERLLKFGSRMITFELFPKKLEEGFLLDLDLAVLSVIDIG